MANKEQLGILFQGVDVWNRWREENPDVKIDLRHASVYGEPLRGTKIALSAEGQTARADLGEANFSGANLHLADLRRADLDDANLSGANLSGANLGGAYLGGADLSGAYLFSADLSGAQLIEVNLSGAVLGRAKLNGANLGGADLGGATLSGANLSDAEVTGLKWDRSKMRGKYLGIRGLDSCFGNPIFKRAAADQDYLDATEAKWAYTWRKRIFRAWGLIDYGRSLWRVAALALSLATIYGAVYSLLPWLLCFDGSANTRFTPFYFSIVTYTTLGFGDVRPATILGEIIVASEVIMGYVTLGLLLAVLAEKIARRS